MAVDDDSACVPMASKIPMAKMNAFYPEVELLSDSCSMKDKKANGYKPCTEMDATEFVIFAHPPSRLHPLQTNCTLSHHGFKRIPR